MTKTEAHAKAERLNEHVGLLCTVIRILPVSQDPILPGDNGWDVHVYVSWLTVQQH